GGGIWGRGGGAGAFCGCGGGAGGGGDLLGGQAIALERVFLRAVFGGECVRQADAHQRRQRSAELFAQEVGPRAAEPADHDALFDRGHQPCIVRKLEHGLLVQRLDRVEVDDRDVDAILRQEFGG